MFCIVLSHSTFCYFRLVTVAAIERVEEMKAYTTFPCLGSRISGWIKPNSIKLFNKNLCDTENVGTIWIFKTINSVGIY